MLHRILISLPLKNVSPSSVQGCLDWTCAHYLVAQHEVTIFEANDYIGGHVNTIDVALQDGKKAKNSNVENSAIDTGFIVFNERTYPNFFACCMSCKCRSKQPT